jgi:hypothetical protein
MQIRYRGATRILAAGLLASLSLAPLPAPAGGSAVDLASFTVLDPTGPPPPPTTPTAPPSGRLVRRPR